MSACPCGGWCACHTNPVYPPPCDVPGGCGLATYTAHPDQPQQPTGPVCDATGCQRPQTTGCLLCAVDTRRLGDWLAQLGAEYERLSAAPSMQAREPDSGGPGGLASHRSPALLDTIVLRDPRSRERSAYDPDGNNARGAFEVLHAHAEAVREGRDLSRPTVHVPACQHACMHRACLLGVGRPIPLPLTVATERALLATHLDWVLMQDWCGEFFDEIRALWGLLRSANGQGAPRRVTRLQTPCTACSVRAVTHRPGDDLVCCQNCGATDAVDREKISA